MKMIAKLKFRKILTSLAFAVGAVILTGPILASATPSGFYLTSASQSVAIGSNFDVTVRLNSAAAVDGMHIEVTYPASLVSVVSLSGGAQPFELAVGDSTATSGVVTIQRFNADTGTTAVTGDNAIATITFKVNAAGTSQIGFNSNTTAVRNSADVTRLTTPQSFNFYDATPPPPPPPVITPPTSGGSSGSTSSSSGGSKSVPKGGSSSTPGVTTSTSAPTSTSQVTADSDGVSSTDNSSKTVKLTFYDSEHNPLKNANIAISDKATATTNDKGEITVKGLAPGSYPVKVVYNGQVYSADFSVADSDSQAIQARNVAIKLRKSKAAIKPITYGAPAVLLLLVAVFFLWRFVLGKRHLTPVADFDAKKVVTMPDRPVTKVAPPVKPVPAPVAPQPEQPVATKAPVEPPVTPPAEDPSPLQPVEPPVQPLPEPVEVKPVPEPSIEPVIAEPSVPVVEAEPKPVNPPPAASSNSHFPARQPGTIYRPDPNYKPEDDNPPSN